MMESVTTNDTGQNVIEINLQRDKRGVFVKVRVAPEVEEFFKRWGGGVVQAPQYRQWTAIDDAKLQLWSFEHQLSRDETDAVYSLYSTGQGFYTDMGGVNLSFISMVGASEGKEFICDAVMSRAELEKVARRLNRAAEHFYTEYIQPTHLNVCISVGVTDVLRGTRI